MGPPKGGNHGISETGPQPGVCLLIAHLQVPFPVGAFLFFSFVHVA